MLFFDAHAHVNFAAFKDEYQRVVKKSLDGGVGLINVGTQKDTSRRAVEIAHEFENEPVFATVGVHPIHVEANYFDPQEFDVARQPKIRIKREGFLSRGEIFDYEYYKKLATDSKVVAIGECGLDFTSFFRERGERLQKRASAETFSESGVENIKSKQKEAFLKQIELARDVKKSLMIHCRDAYPELMDILVRHYKPSMNCPGIAHFFSGTKEHATKLVDLGFYFTFGGVITFARSYDEVIRSIPMKRILSETDAPYVSPVPYRGKRNEPVYVVEVVKKLAEIKKVSLEKMRMQILENVKRAFDINVNATLNNQ